MLVVTPNTCVDITTWLPTLVPGAVLRAPRTELTAGGKGVNVCRVLRGFGRTPRLVGLASAEDDRLARLLAAEGTQFLPVHHPGPGRVAQIILEDSGRATVINGAGPRISPELWSDLLRTVSRDLADVPGAMMRPVIACGSLPPGAPVEGYGQIVELAHAAGQPAIVDAAPAVLAAALPAGPDLVSPNLAEAEGLLLGRSRELVDEGGEDVPERCLQASLELHARGARRAVVTGGSAGAALATETGSRWFPGFRVDVKNPIGAGDTFVGAWAEALLTGLGDEAAMRFACATAAAGCEQELAGAFARERLAELLASDQGRPVGRSEAAR